MEAIRIKDKTFSLYIGENALQARIEALAMEINSAYAASPPLLVPVLNGAFLFTADLVRHMNPGSEIHFVRVSSYGDAMDSSGNVRTALGLEVEISDRHILIIEDIVDSGLTCDFLKDQFLLMQPASVKIATLLYKPVSHRGKYKPDFVGFEIPPAFVVGYGLDYAQLGRELRGIYRLSSGEE
ncbi:MAG: hypoxanthine phosphoribosyltransferase [Bacteroidia bacterium]